MKRLALASVLAIAVASVYAAWPSHAQTKAAKPPAPGLAVATFAGGCFWCMEAAFQHVPGVVHAIAGYTGGHVPNPSYQQVSERNTGHQESVRVVYNPKQLTYRRLLTIYWHNIDPFDGGGQFCDRGDEYRPVIFYHSAEQKRLAEASKANYAAKFTKPIAVAIEPAKTFYVAEEYHQDYYEKNPIRYKFYRYNCGRDQRLQQVWGKAPAEQ